MSDVLTGLAVLVTGAAIVVALYALGYLATTGRFLVLPGIHYPFLFAGLLGVVALLLLGLAWVFDGGE